jgi:two-component system LytT family sensor kinase
MTIHASIMEMNRVAINYVRGQVGKNWSLSLSERSPGRREWNHSSPIINVHQHCSTPTPGYWTPVRGKAIVEDRVRELHATAGLGTFFAADLVGYTAGLLMTALLLALTLRALRLPGASAANVIFAACALLWSGGGLAYAALLASGAPRAVTLAPAAEAVQFLGAAAFPIAILAAWRPFATRPGQKRALRILQLLARVSAAGIALTLLYETIFGSLQELIHAEHFTAWNATILLCLGAAASLRRSSAPRAVFVPSLVIIAASAGAAVLIPVAHHASLRAPGPAIGNHVLQLIVLCAFFLFARFRYADVFIRYSVRILLAAGFAMLLALAAHWIITSRFSSAAPLTPAFHVFGITVLAAALMLAFAFADVPIGKVIHRWLFHSPDYRAQSKDLGEILRGLETEAEIACAVANTTQQSLQLEDARLIALEDLPRPDLPDGVMDGETVELAPSDSLRARLPLLNVEFLVPIDSAGQVTHLLLVSPGSNRPALVTNDLNYLRTVAAQCGNRLDALRRERENVERRSREAVLLQQVTEAELRALRSQVNPHFLFNSLNTIADLIVNDPARAEEMTLRLAEVFRHVLAHSSRSLTSVRDEIEFLRTYLYIEEARFRDRLQVEFDVAPETAAEQIPSLILQPLVENAVKHGLAPKPGAGHLWISAGFQGDRLRLRVEDDGVGLNGNARRRSGSKHNGLGLSNIAERLKALYRDRASVEIEPREAGGSRVTLLIPRADSGRPL